MPNLKDFVYLTLNTNNDRWHDNTGCQYPLVCPKGTKVKFKSVLRNYYGTWFKVEYNGKIRYVMPCLVDGNVMIKLEEIVYFDVPSCKLCHIVYFTDRNNNKYRLLNEEGELELL